MATGDFDLHIQDQYKKAMEVLDHGPIASCARDIARINKRIDTSIGIMSRILNANPINESRELPNGAIIATETIFRHLTEKGLTPEALEMLIPVSMGGRHNLGTLYGFDIFIDGDGRLFFDEEIITEVEKEENAIRKEEALEACSHTGFVVRNIQGENRFLCKECNARFPRHPQMIKIVHNTTRVTRATMEDMRATLNEFRQGAISFSSAMKVLNTNLEEFTKACSQLFPPDEEWMEQRTIGNGKVNRVLINVEPVRVSCPKLVEEYFSDMSVNADALLPEGKFPDIVGVSHNINTDTDRIIIDVDFIDGTTQKVNTITPYDPYRGLTF